MYKLSTFKSFFSKGSERTLLVKKHTIALFLIKGVHIVISFLLVPLTIGYINADNYGVWITISSIIGWFNFLDIGLNNGLRNRFTQAKAKNDLDLAQRYVSTTYLLMSFISIVLFLVYLIAQNYLDWNSILKTSSPIPEIKTVVLIVFAFFSVRFTLSTITIICIADQRPAYGNFINIVGELITLLIIFILVKTTVGSLLYLSYGLCLAPTIIYLVFNIFLFNSKYKNVKPSFKKVDFSLVKDLFNIGIAFFVIQIAMIIQFQTSNLIIIRSFGESDVTSYSVTFQYFSILTMAFTILITPLWSSFADAYARNDLEWIKNVVKKYRQVLLILFIGGFVMLILSKFAFKLWLGDNKVNTFLGLSFSVLIYTFSLIYGRIEGTVLNGIGALKIQMYSALFSPFVFLLMAYVFINVFKIGIYSVPIAGVIANFNSFILAPLQYKKVFIKNKKGIWIK